MVASAVFMLLLASCGLALRSAMQYHRRVSEQTELENGLMRAIGALTRDASETAPRAIAWADSAPEGPAVTFPIPRGENGALLRDPSAGNRLLYASVVSYRVTGDDKQLRRYVDVLDPPERHPPHPLIGLTPERDATYFSAPAHPYKILLSGIVSFTCVAKTIDPSDGVEADAASGSLTYQNFTNASGRERTLQARYAFRAGVATAMAKLTADPSWCPVEGSEYVEYLDAHQAVGFKVWLEGINLDSDAPLTTSSGCTLVRGQAAIRVVPLFILMCSCLALFTGTCATTARISVLISTKRY